MNIQDSPKQIALKAEEQLNKLKEKYISMVGPLENAAPAVEAQSVVEESVAAPEPNMFDVQPSVSDAPVVETPEQGTAFNPTPVQEEAVVNPEPVQNVQENIFDSAPASESVAPAEPAPVVSNPEVPAEPVAPALDDQNNNQVNMFDQMGDSQPTNAEIIGENQNIFETNNVFDSAPAAEVVVPTEPTVSNPEVQLDTNVSEPVQNNVFDAPAVESAPEIQEPVAAQPVEQVASNNSMNLLNSLKDDYANIVNSANSLNEMINNFGNKLASYGIDNNVQFLNQNVVSDEFNNNQSMHM